MHCWTFDRSPISWNTPFFLIILLDTSIYLKVFVNFKLTRFSLCPTNILLDAGGGGMRYLNLLMLGTILVMLIYLPFL